MTLNRAQCLRLVEQQSSNSQEAPSKPLGSKGFTPTLLASFVNFITQSNVSLLMWRASSTRGLPVTAASWSSFWADFLHFT